MKLFLAIFSVTIVFAVQLAWSDDVEIQAGRSSDGQKTIVVKEGADLHILCETSATDASIEWFMNEFTKLESGERVAMTEHSETVNGQVESLHTLIILNSSSTMDIAIYECRLRSRSASDEVDVKIVRHESIQYLNSLQCSQ